MDPPSAQEEWASLVEETNNDGGLCPINPSGGTGARGGRRPTTKPPSSSASQTSGSGTASRLISTARSRLNNMRSGGGGGFSFRHMLVIFILSGMLGILIIIVSNAETSIETAAVTDVEVVHHESIVSDIAVEPTDIGGGKSIESGEQSIDNESTGGDLAGDSNIAQSTPEESTKSNNSETATSEKTTSSPVQTDANTILGFHDASPESFTHANYYLKPKGVGYPLAPKGGLHPIYIHDAENADQMTSYGDDFSENSPYADDRLKLTPEQRKEEQNQWETHLNEIREKYGSWNFKDTYREKNGKERPVVDFETIGKEKESKKEGYNSLHGEIEKEDFPAGVWQTDNE